VTARFLPSPLDSFGKQGASQNDEQGIIAALIDRIDLKPSFVEFGVHPWQGNCLFLRCWGWDGLFMDAEQKAPYIKNEWITPGNIMELFSKYGVSQDLGVLSIDIDGQDFYVWQAITISPAVVVIEYTGTLPTDRALIMPRNDDFVVTPGRQSYGASLLAINLLARRKGYHLVYANGVNAFFVRNDLLLNPQDFVYDRIARMWPTEHVKDPAALGFTELKFN